MATSLMPVDPAATPQRTNRLLAISASLLPEEITLARRARRTRGWVIIVVVLVAVLLGVWFFFANQETQAADAELTNATGEVTALQRDQRDYAQVVDVQNDTQVLTRQLKAVMADDLAWSTLLSTLNDTAGDADVSLDTINGSLVKASSTGTATSSASGKSTIGSLLISGAAPDKDAVAAYLELLGKQTLVTNPYLTAINETDDEDPDKKIDFNLNVDITSASLCGRFGDKCDSAGGN